jgi:hypothetical protein
MVRALSSAVLVVVNDIEVVVVASVSVLVLRLALDSGQVVCVRRLLFGVWRELSGLYSRMFVLGLRLELFVFESGRLCVLGTSSAPLEMPPHLRQSS